jgi:peptide/nickel transport system substrate-binding protein
MARMVVDFRLRDDILWSDGQALTARDSVFAFELDADIDTPTIKYLVDRTLTYEAVDATVARWTGVPGFMDAAYQTNFYSPLPQHVLAEFAPGELLAVKMAAETPLGWGAYMIQEWRAGEQIVLEKNPAYFRSEEGLPRFDRLVFRFLGDISPEGAIQQVITGECDVVDEALLPLQALDLIREQEDEGRVGLAWAPGRLMERMEMIISPGDLAAPAFFLDTSTREAVGRCIDREAILEAELGGLGEIPDSYLPPGHPLYSPAEGWIDYDPETGRSLLQQAGWDLIEGQSGSLLRARLAFGVEAGTEFSVKLVAGDGPLARTVGERIQSDLAACGIQVEVQHLGAAEMFAAWPEGPLFGRQVNMGLWAWPNHIVPACEMFMGAERAGEDQPLGINASGLQDAQYDQACQRAMIASPGSEAYSQAVEDTQDLFRGLIPAVPLFSRPRLMAHRPGICGVSLDASSLTGFWNLEAIAEGENCN